MANGNGNGDSFRVSRATLTILLAFGSPIALLSWAGYTLREQVKINEQQQARIERMEADKNERIIQIAQDEWNLERDVKAVREDTDWLLIKHGQRAKGTQ